MLFLGLYRAVQSMEQLSFDSPAETDVVKKFPTPSKVFVCLPGTGIESESSRMASARSIHSVTKAIYISLLGRDE